MVEFLKNWGKDFGPLIQAATSTLQFLASALLLWVTWLYVRSTRQLLSVQIEPVLSLETGRSEKPIQVIIANNGAVDLIGFRLAIRDVRFIAKRGHPAGRAMVYNPKATWTELKVGDEKRIEIDNEVLTAFTTGQSHKSSYARQYIVESGGLLSDSDIRMTQVISLEVSFQRKADRRSFTSVRKYLLLSNPDGSPCLVEPSTIGHVQTAEEYLEGRG